MLRRRTFFCLRLGKGSHGKSGESLFLWRFLGFRRKHGSGRHGRRRREKWLAACAALEWAWTDFSAVRRFGTVGNSARRSGRRRGRRWRWRILGRTEGWRRGNGSGGWGCGHRCTRARRGIGPRQTSAQAFRRVNPLAGYRSQTRRRGRSRGWRGGGGARRLSVVPVGFSLGCVRSGLGAEFAC